MGQKFDDTATEDRAGPAAGPFAADGKSNVVKLAQLLDDGQIGFVAVPASQRRRHGEEVRWFRSGRDGLAVGRLWRSC